MLQLQQVVPSMSPIWAVFTNVQGEPEFVPVVVYGFFKEKDSGKTLVCGFGTGEHLDPVDLVPGFVSYTDNPDIGAWSERCKEVRKAISQAKLDKVNGKPRIIIPEKKVETPWNS